MENNEMRDGWIIPPNMMTAHYIKEGRALCGAFRYTPKQPGPDGTYREDYCCSECLELRTAQLRQSKQLSLSID